MDIDRIVTEMVKFNFEMMFLIVILNMISIGASVYLLILALK